MILCSVVRVLSLFWGILMGAGVAAAAEPASAPRLLNLPEMVTADDYPTVSVFRGEEGTVTVEVQVDPSGVVTSCTIAQSSGHSALDAQTCAVFRARARFAPATNRAGRPVAGTYSRKVVWRLERVEPPPMPRQAWMIRTTVALSKAGNIVDCKLEATGVAAKMPDCDVIMAMGKAKAGEEGITTEVAGFTVMENYFYPVDSSKAAVPPDLSGVTRFAQQVSRVVIAPDGQVKSCEGVRYSGLASPDRDACTLIRAQRFVPAVVGSEDLVGTVVVRAYLRAHTVT